MPKPEGYPQKVLREWETFLRSGLEQAHFTPTLHHHFLHNTNGGIGGVGGLAQYYKQNFATYHGLVGFFVWFREPDSQVITDWYNSKYADLNRKLCAVYQNYKENIDRIAAEKQKEDTLLGVGSCLAKYGLSLQLLEEWAQTQNLPMDTAQQVVGAFFRFKDYLLGNGIYEKPIIYRDSAGIYDEIDGTHLTHPFYGIGVTDEAKAAAKATARYCSAKNKEVKRGKALAGSQRL